MRMTEGENIVQYCAWIKEVINATKGANGKIDNDTIIKKSIENSTFYLFY